MFEMRFSETYGASSELLEHFLIQARLDEGQDGCMLFQVRGRQEGRLSWAKCPPAVAGGVAQAHVDQLSNEAQVLRGLDHQHICALDGAQDTTHTPYLVFAYWGQQLLSEREWAEWPEVDQARAVIQLVDAVSYLQALDEPVSHGAIELNQLWAAPATRWVQLAGFEDAQIGAQAEALKLDRQAVASLAAKVLTERSGELGWLTCLDDWVEQGSPAVDELKAALQLCMLHIVTADL